nr:hypothetical protein [Streptomyces sp. FT05W]
MTEKLGIGSREALRNWLKQHEIEAGTRPGTTSEESAQLKASKEENAELKRANAKPRRLSSRPASTGHTHARSVHRRALSSLRWRRADLPAVSVRKMPDGVMCA